MLRWDHSHNRNLVPRSQTPRFHRLNSPTTRTIRFVRVRRHPTSSTWTVPRYATSSHSPNTTVRVRSSMYISLSPNTYTSAPASDGTGFCTLGVAYLTPRAPSFTTPSTPSSATTPARGSKLFVRAGCLYALSGLQARTLRIHDVLVSSSPFVSYTGNGRSRRHLLVCNDVELRLRPHRH